jgi:beta-lactamase superfamily II metal-dependent hydrolase
MKKILSLILVLSAILSVFATAPAVAAPQLTDPAMQSVWQRTDQPVEQLKATRTWIWGPAGFDSRQEAYAESPGGQRTVEYFDKSRMEITNPNGDRGSQWFVTNGLLTKELITGQMQVGDAQFEGRSPAQIPVAGDPDDRDGPTYASFSGLLGKPARSIGSIINETLARNGDVGGGGPGGVSTAYLVPETSHAVASVFWDFLNSSGTVYDSSYVRGRLFDPTFFATGFPITDAYWAQVKVAGQTKWVLIQVFERRVLTYTPDNPEGWKVEMGNIGRHYHDWRYGGSGPAPASGELKVSFIDVGQGDSILVQSPDGKNVLIDAGPPGGGELAYLQGHGISKLDAVIATHPHADHIGEMPQIIGTLRPADVWTSGQSTTTNVYERMLDAIASSGAGYHEAKRGDTIQVGSLAFSVLSPTGPDNGDLNNGSLVTRLQYGGISFLFTGDVQAEGEQGMLASGQNVQATVLKVAHHGSHTSSTMPFLEAVHPQEAVYSAGLDNNYGHPHQETLSNLVSVGATVYGTDVNGTVVVTTNGSGYSISTTKSASPRASPSGMPVANPTPAPAPSTLRVIGNPNSMVYHLPSCRYAGMISHPVPFDRPSAALAAGYRPCKVCNPPTTP